MTPRHVYVLAMAVLQSGNMDAELRAAVDAALQYYATTPSRNVLRLINQDRSEK